MASSKHRWDERPTQTEKFDIAITLGNYDFLNPEGWQLQNNGEHILIQNMQLGCLIRILAPYASSGDLEKDAQGVFDLNQSTFDTLWCSLYLIFSGEQSGAALKVKVRNY